MADWPRGTGHEADEVCQVKLLFFSSRLQAQQYDVAGRSY